MTETVGESRVLGAHSPPCVVVWVDRRVRAYGHAEMNRLTRLSCLNPFPLSRGRVICPCTPLHVCTPRRHFHQLKVAMVCARNALLTMRPLATTDSTSLSPSRRSSSTRQAQRIRRPNTFRTVSISMGHIIALLDSASESLPPPWPSVSSSCSLLSLHLPHRVYPRVFEFLISVYFHV